MALIVRWLSSWPLGLFVFASRETRSANFKGQMSEPEHQDGRSLPRAGRRVLRGSRNTSLQGSQEELTSLAKPLESNMNIKPPQENAASENSVNIECAVCLQTCVHPVRLPCTHIFCYLCVKGVAFQSKRCAMCRQEIPTDFLVHPQLLDRTQLERESALDDGYQWFYEGRNGWWQYDERTSVELETAYKRSQRLCELLIAGFLYIIDFDQMLQYRKSEPTRRRRIKRDLASIPKKGVAGLRVQASDEQSAIGTDGSGQENATMDLLSVAASRAATLNSATNCGLSPTPQAPSNTPQTPQTPQTPRSPPSPILEEELTVVDHRRDLNQLLLPSTADLQRRQQRWQERERRRLRRAMEEIERLRLDDGSDVHHALHPTGVVYYNMDTDPDLLISGQPIESSSSSSSSSTSDSSQTSDSEDIEEDLGGS